MRTCAECGELLAGEQRFCTRCGTPAPPAEQPARRRRLAAAPTLAAAVLAGAMGFGAVALLDAQEASVAAIKSTLADMYVAKIEADRAVRAVVPTGATVPVAAARRTLPQVRRIAERARAARQRLEEMSPPDELRELYVVTYRWESRVVEALDDLAAQPASDDEVLQTWGAVPAVPEDVTVVLPSDQAEAVLQETLDAIERARDDGSRAVAAGDAAAMTPVAAALSAESYWTQQQAICPKGGCDQGSGELFLKPYRSVMPWTAVAAETAQQIAGDALPPEIGITDAWQPIRDSSVTEGAPETPALPPNVQGFFDECAGRGGTLGNGVKVGAPIASGYSCYYGPGKNQWDMLTDSGRRYSGVNPPPRAVADPPLPQPEQPDWAGRWTGSAQIVASGDCTGGLSFRVVLDLTQNGSAVSGTATSSTTRGSVSCTIRDRETGESYTLPVPQSELFFQETKPVSGTVSGSALELRLTSGRRYVFQRSGDRITTQDRRSATFEGVTLSASISIDLSRG